MIAVTVAMFKRSVLPIGERFRDCPRKSRNRGKQIDSVINIPECFTTTFDIWKIVICDPLKVVFFFCFRNKNFMTLKEHDMEHDTTRHSLLSFFFQRYVFFIPHSKLTLHLKKKLNVSSFAWTFIDEERMDGKKMEKTKTKINKPDRATMRPDCVSACIEHVT